MGPILLDIALAVAVSATTTTATTTLATASLPPYPIIPLNIDWPSFLHRSDPVWAWNGSASTTLPSEWVDSLFGGSGDLGFLVWCEDAHSLRVDVSRTTVYDDRSFGMASYMNNFVYDQPRLPIGHLYLSWPNHTLASASGRIRLHDAVAEVNLTASSGAKLGLTMFASADAGASDVIVMLLEGAGWNARWVAEVAQSTWSGDDPSYTPNPPPLNQSSNPAPNSTLELTIQPHLKGTAHATGVLQTRDGGELRSLVLTISPVLPSPSDAAGWATAQVTAALEVGLKPLLDRHLAWWHAWWPSGGVITLDFSVLESFWYIQLYKFASASRAGRALHDLMGPWFIDGTGWPDLHWDMNLQQTYYLPIAANRPDLVAPLVDFIASLGASGALNANVPDAWQADSAAAPTGASSLQGIQTCYWNYGPDCKTAPPAITGNLLWVLQLVQLAGSYGGNASIATGVVWPLLGRALQAYQHFQLFNASGDGRVHLPPTFSPEYPGPVGPDANYDLSLYRYGLALALELAATYGLSSPFLPAWNATLSLLSDYPVDPVTGTFEIYRGTPYGTPHRHYSHLFMVWPLRALNFSEGSGEADTARRSVNLWLATPEQDSQFYRPAASAMNLMLGQRAAAFDNVTFLLRSRIEANTFYREGAAGSCTETPYAAAWAVVDWMLGSWRRVDVPGLGAALRVLDLFPGVDDVIALDAGGYAAAPAKAATASFWRLGAEGGYLLSSARVLVSRNATAVVSRIAFVGVEALVTADPVAPLLLGLGGMPRPLVATPQGITLEERGGGMVQVLGVVPGGQGAVIYPGGPYAPPPLEIVPTPGCPYDFNHWGWPLGGAPSPVVLRPCAYGADGRAVASQRYAFVPGPTADGRNGAATTGVLALQDGSGRCLAPATCSASDGTLAVLLPCAGTSLGASPAPPLGCDNDPSCGPEAQFWSYTAPTDSPPNALLAPGGLCLAVHGSFDPDRIDLWDCGTQPGEFRNLEWLLNATSGAVVTLDTHAPLAGMCLTPA